MFIKHFCAPGLHESKPAKDRLNPSPLQPRPTSGLTTREGIRTYDTKISVLTFDFTLSSALSFDLGPNLVLCLLGHSLLLNGLI